MTREQTIERFSFESFWAVQKISIAKKLPKNGINN